MQLSPQSLRLLNTLALRAKRSFYGMRQGAHRSQRRGHGVEFAEYRQYEVGDNPRAIDWNLYSRSDKLYIKRYLEEENVVLYIVIDGSRSMTHTELRQKWDLATYLTLAASYIALATQDPVVISVLGGPHSPRFWGGRAFSPLTTFMRETSRSIVSNDQSPLDLVSAAKRAATRVRFPGILLYISDFLYAPNEVAASLSHFRARNMEIHAVQVLGEADCSLEHLPQSPTVLDSETSASQGLLLSSDSRIRYESLLAEHIASIRNHCLSHQISFTSLRYDSSKSLEESALSTISAMGLFV